MSHIDHTSHAHPATPAARKACRKASAVVTTQSAAAAGLVAVDREAPFNKRAIVINIRFESGQRCSVPFDRYGKNSELFRTAVAYGWSADRTIAQAISEALAGAMRSYPGQQIATYVVTEVN